MILFRNILIIRYLYPIPIAMRHLKYLLLIWYFTFMKNSIMVRWIWGMSLKDRKCREDLYSLLGIQCVAYVARHGRIWWFGHLKHKSGDDWVSSCRNMEWAGVKCIDRGRKTRGECVKDDMELFALQPEWAIFRDMWWRDLILGNMSNPSMEWKRKTFSK